MNCENCGDDLSGEADPEAAQKDCKALSIGRKWMEDSSLESWFPITAEELTHLRSECDKKDAEIVTLKNCLFQMQNAAKDLTATLATYKAAVVEARGALDLFVTTWSLAHPIQRLLVFEECAKDCGAALHTLSALTGDATKTP